MHANLVPHMCKECVVFNSKKGKGQYGTLTVTNNTIQTLLENSLVFDIFDH